MNDVSEYLAVYLSDPGAVPGIGPERGKKPTSGIGRFKSPHSSVRYVWYEHDFKTVEHAEEAPSLGRGTRVARRYLAKFYFCRVLRKRGSISGGTQCKSRRSRVQFSRARGDRRMYFSTVHSGFEEG